MHKAIIFRVLSTIKARNIRFFVIQALMSFQNQFLWVFNFKLYSKVFIYLQALLKLETEAFLSFLAYFWYI